MGGQATNPGGVRGDDSGYEGLVEEVAYRTVVGWAWSRHEPGRQLVVRVSVNGTITGTARAEVFREDLLAARIGDGRHGFEFRIPAAADEVDDVTVSIEDSAAPLPYHGRFSIDVHSNHPPVSTADRLVPPEWGASGRCRLPSFFLLGAAKAGTTSLHYYLTQHPDVCMSHPKEPMFFEGEYHSGVRFYMNRYFAHWNSEPIVGEARHRNLYLPYVPARIHQYNPDARLLVLLRDPVERLVSHWWHWFARGREHLDLAEAVSADLQRLAKGLCLETEQERQIYEWSVWSGGGGCYRTYVDSGYYARQIERYTARFGAEAVKILWYDDLAVDPVPVVQSALTHVGADPDRADGFDYVRMNVALPGFRDHLDAALLAALVQHYAPHNRRLEELTGRSLASWDHPFGVV